MAHLAITLGDPAGIGSEVVLKALGDLDPEASLVVFGSWDLAREAPVAIPDRLRRVDPADIPAEPGWWFADVGKPASPFSFGRIDAAWGGVALESIEAALAAIDEGRCGALVTGPIQKQAVLAAGSRFSGHTELLAARYGRETYGRDYAMLFDSPRLRVALVSVHVPLARAVELATAEAVSDLAVLIDREHLRLFGSVPRIAAAGVNPHAGEGGHFGHEDARIATGVVAAREKGVNVSGPFAPDTVFQRAATGAFDVVLAAYHDQGLIAVKTLDFARSVNVTVGLPILRCSVDHGTAFDIAGRGIADASPMRFAIEWAIHHQENRP